MSARTATIATLLIACIGTAHAAQVTIGGCTGPAAGYGLTSCVAGASVTDFNTGALPAAFSGTGSVFAGTTGTWATPAGDSSDYLAVTTSSPVGSEDIRPGGVHNYLGLLWGSIDKYNEIDAYLNGVRVDTVLGQDVIGAQTSFGDQHAAGSNEYVNILFSGGYDEIVLKTTNYNFEVDNIAVATVPEPATLGLLAIGVAGLGMRRRRH